MFEHSLLATQQKVQSKFRALFFPIAVGVHALGGGRRRDRSVLERRAGA